MNYLTCPHCGETYRNITAVHVCSSGPYAVKLPADTNINTKEWVSLTDDEEIELDEKYGDDFNAYIDARDAKLKEKNT